MKLREKLKSYAMDNHFKKYGELNAKELEKIADDFAVNFGEWLMNKCHLTKDKSSWRWYSEEYTTKELLEIYKKEKNL